MTNEIRFKKTATFDTATGEEFQPINCMVCGKEAEISDGTTDKGWAEVRRGALTAVSTDGVIDYPERENIKFSRHICPDCFLTDPDLCAFFNRCGCRIR